MANVRAEIVGRKVVGQAKEGLDHDIFDLVEGKPFYPRHNHEDPDHPGRESHVVYGEDEFGPFPNVRLIGVHNGVPYFVICDDDGLECLAQGKKVHNALIDGIDDGSVAFDEQDEPYFRAFDGDGERAVHGSWKSIIHEAIGNPILHKGRVFYPAVDDGVTHLMCKGEEVTEHGFDALCIIDTEGDDLICAAVDNGRIEEIRIRIA